MNANVHRRTHALTGETQLVAPIGEISTCAYEVNLVSQAEQRRLAFARPVAEGLAKSWSAINEIDHWLRQHAREVRTLRRAAVADKTQRFEPMWTPRIYWLAIIMICGLEVGLNKYGLDGLQATEPASWAMAVLFSVCVSAIGKTTAKAIRQQIWQRSDYGGLFVIAAANVLMVATIIHIAEARAFVGEVEAAREGFALMDGTVVGFAAMVLTGYFAVLCLSLGMIDPDPVREQRELRIERLSKRISSNWKRRKALAESYNASLIGAEMVLETLAHDLIERSSQFRDGNMRSNRAPPAYFSQALPLAVLKPLHLGYPVDPEPADIAAVIDAARQSRPFEGTAP